MRTSLNPTSAASLSCSRPAPFEAHALAYRKFLLFEGADQESSPHVHVEISGGYRYENSASTPYPNYDEDGLFHALSGDHIVLYIRNLSARVLHVRIVHFGCDFGIQTIYPNDDMVEGVPTFREQQPQNSTMRRRGTKELSLHFRVGMRPACSGQISGKLRECFKVFVSEQPVSFKCFDFVPTNEIRHLQERWDPVAWAGSETELAASEDDHGLDHEILDIALGGYRPQIESESGMVSAPGTGAWSCQNVIYMLHPDSDSLTEALYA